ncbi:hypothetical protein EDB85DRAFT_987940 [Lactarius pseudohatsudake]|nr:hypothetical protein EDB85DRAFT_987940 [Lactarius pseudohatsudake]
MPPSPASSWYTGIMLPLFLPFGVRLEVSPLNWNSCKSDNSHHLLNSLISHFPPRQFVLAFATLCPLSLSSRPGLDYLSTLIQSHMKCCRCTTTCWRQTEPRNKTIEVLLRVE